MSYMPININVKKRAGMATFVLTLWLGALTGIGQIPQANEIRDLLPNQPLEREMTGAELHRYAFDLKVNEFFQVRAEQKGVDVIFKLLDASGATLATMDSPNGKEGPETLSFVAAKAGRYTLQVIGFDEKAGKGIYTIQRGAARSATAKDHRRVEVERSFTEAVEEQNPELAITKLEKVAAGWKELDDRYMLDLTTRQSKQLKGDKLYKEALNLMDTGVDKLYEAALEKFLDAATIFLEIGNKEGQAHSVFWMGFLAHKLGDTDISLRYYRFALARFKELANDSMIGTTLNNMGLVYYDLNEKQKALDYYNASLQPLRASGEKRKEAVTLNSIAVVYVDWNQPEKAMELLTQALTIAKEAKDKSAEAKTLTNLGSLYLTLSNFQKALDYYNQALTLRRELEDEMGAANVMSYIANAKAQQESQSLPDNPPLPVGRTVKRQLNSNNEGHTYRVDLKQGQVLRVDVREKGIDVSIALFSVAANRIIANADLIDGFGRETLLYVAEQTGDYRIFVLPNAASSNRNYELTAEIKQAATPDDKERIKAFGLWKEALVGKNKGDRAGYQEAIAKWEEALSLWRKLDEKYWEAHTNIYLGFVYFLLGETKKALDYYNHALPLEKGAGDTNGEATTLSNIGSIYHMLGDRQEALKYYTQALPLFRAADNKKDEAIMLSKTGSVYMDADKSQEALKYFEQALLLFRTVDSKNDEAIVLNNMAVSYQALGENEKAVTYYKAALSLHRKLGDKAGAAKALSNIGAVYAREGNILATFSFYTRALLAATNIGEKELEATIWHNMMLAWVRSGGNRRKAILFGKQSVNRLQQLRGAAQGLDSEVQKSFLQNIKHPYKDLSELMIMEGQLEQAVQVLNLYQDQQFFDFDHEANAPVPQISLSAREQKFARLYETAADRLSQIGLQMDNLVEQIGMRQPNEQEAAQQKKLNDELTAALDSFLTFMLSGDTEFAKPLDEQDKIPAPTDVPEMQAALRELSATTKQNPVALYTLIGRDNFYVLLITTNEIKVFESPVEPDDLKKKLWQFYALLQTPSYDPRTLGKELYDIILKPIEGELKKRGAQILMWSLDNNLRYIPMAALWDGEKYLVERYQNVVFTRANRERMTRNVNRSWTGTGFGNTQEHTIALPGGETNVKFDALPGVSQELQSIFRVKDKAQGLLNGEVFFDTKFTRNSFYEALKKGRPLVHISSHFLLRPGDASKSFLLLGDGEIITLAEMKGQKNIFQGVELLTLSACDTATQVPDDNGREIDGFAELAQRLGASSVLASLWQVRDTSTAQLMMQFYKNREVGKHNKAEALRIAQLELLYGKLDGAMRAEPLQSSVSGRGRSVLDNIVLEEKYRVTFKKDNSKPFAHPYYWSPFILFGNWR